ncbi:hypothetical protein ACEWY0_27280, partial [Klebsiella pneumoniae]
LLLCHGTVCVVGKMRDLILQLSKSSIYSTKPVLICYERERYHGLAPLLTIRGRDLKGKERVSWLN